jgi:hypothetical protein
MSILGGILLIGLGILFLLGQIFEGFDFWGTLWPLFLVGVGALFFAGMLAGGKSSAGLAVPGSIIASLGLLMFIQNLTDHWESWAYTWSVIIFSIGLGIYIKGVYGEEQRSRRSGMSLMRLGAILFLIFGIFFELIFSSSEIGNYVLPIALIVVGLYLLVRRSGRPAAVREEIRPQAAPPTPAKTSIEAEIESATETPSPDQQ